MYLTPLLRFSTSSSLLAKSEYLVVMCESLVSGHAAQRIRLRKDDKLEFFSFDPLVQKRVLYRETKKIRSMPMPRRGQPKYEIMVGTKHFRNRDEIWHLPRKD